MDAEVSNSQEQPEYRYWNDLVPRPEATRVVSVTTPDGARLDAYLFEPQGQASGEPVVFVHGNGGHHEVFLPLARDVAAAGRVAVCIDTRAQGTSTRGNEERLTYELFAADTLLVMDELGVSRASIVGYSDGGIVGLLLARDCPERVSAVVSCGANLSPEGLPAEDNESVAAGVRRLTARAQGLEPDERDIPSPDPDDPESAEQIAEWMAEEAAYTPAEATQAAELLQLMLDEPHIDPASLGAIRCSVAVMAGEHDIILPQETDLIARSILGARKVIVSECGHGLPKEAPAAVMACLQMLW